jgi:predicted DCC family thiol-disulfide oxidoreductase YuxK
MEEESGKVIMLFDGVCNFCNASVNFILPRDKKDHFRFSPLQSEAGKSLLLKYKVNSSETDSVILIENGTAYFRSEAALRILKNMGRGWFLLYVFIIVPTFIRDPVYNWIARNRYKWFGKRETCRLPEDTWKNKFIS